MCDATVSVQKIPGTTPALSLISCSNRWPSRRSTSPQIKYIIYKGILASSLIAANGTDVAPASPANQLAQLAWDVQARKNAAASTSAAAPAAALAST